MKTFTRGADVTGGAFYVTREREVAGIDCEDGVTIMAADDDHLRLNVNIEAGMATALLTFDEFAQVLVTGLKAFWADRDRGSDHRPQGTPAGD